MITKSWKAASLRQLVNRRGLAIGLGSLIFLSGCATSPDLVLIHDDLFRIEEKINVLQGDFEKKEQESKRTEKKALKSTELAKEVSEELSKEYSKEAELTRKNQADIQASLIELRDSLQVLRGELERHGHNLSETARRMDSLDAKLGIHSPEAVPAPAAGSTVPSPAPGMVALDPNQLYQTAYGDYQKGSYSWAILGFKEYLGKHPQSELADDAQYLLGESYYSLKDYLNSLVEFDKILQLYPQSGLVASAYLKSAYALLELKRIPEATERLNAVIEKYPNSNEAKQAQEQLKSTP